MGSVTRLPRAGWETHPWFVLLPCHIERLFGIDRRDDDVYRGPPEMQEATDHRTCAKGPQVVLRSCHVGGTERQSH